MQINCQLSVVHGDRGVTNPEISAKIAKVSKGASLPELPVSPDLESSGATTSFSLVKPAVKVKKEILDEEVQVLTLPSRTLAVSWLFAFSVTMYLF